MQGGMNSVSISSDDDIIIANIGLVDDDMWIAGWAILWFYFVIYVWVSGANTLADMI